MTSDARRAILDQVAAGILDPVEAASRLDDLDEQEAPAGARSDRRADEPPADRDPEAGGWDPTVAEERLRGVRVVASAGSVRVVGDPDIAEVSVNGPHTMRRSGDILVVECGPMHGRAMGTAAPTAGFASAWVFSRGGQPTVHMPRWGGAWRQTTVRVNPSIPLDLEVTAGQLVLRGSAAAIRCAVNAGSASLDDVQGPIAATVAAASLSVRGPIRSGESRIECDMGAATIHLEEGADVRVRVRTSLGRAVVDLDEEPVTTEGGLQEWVVGRGRAQLAVEANLGSVSVHRASADDTVPV